MAQPQIDREKLRAAIRRMGSDYLFLMVDAAITVLTQDSLRTLVKGFLNPDELQPDGKEEMSLLRTSRHSVRRACKVSIMRISLSIPRIATQPQEEPWLGWQIATACSTDVWPR